MAFKLPSLHGRLNSEKTLYRRLYGPNTVCLESSTRQGDNQPWLLWIGFCCKSEGGEGRDQEISE